MSSVSADPGKTIGDTIDLIRSIGDSCDQAVEALYGYEAAGDQDSERAQRDARRAAIEGVFAEIGDVLSEADRLREALPTLRKALTVKGPTT